eukprot:6028465-Prymnesium_polylepis.1
MACRRGSGRRHAWCLTPLTRKVGHVGFVTVRRLQDCTTADENRTFRASATRGVTFPASNCTVRFPYLT